MGKAELLRSTALLIHFSWRSNGWPTRGKRKRLAFGLAVLSLACGIDAVYRYLAFAVVLTQVRTQRR